MHQMSSAMKVLKSPNGLKANSKLLRKKPKKKKKQLNAKSSKEFRSTS